MGPCILCAEPHNLTQASSKASAKSPTLDEIDMALLVLWVDPSEQPEAIYKISQKKLDQQWVNNTQDMSKVLIEVGFSELKVLSTSFDMVSCMQWPKHVSLTRFCCRDQQCPFTFWMDQGNIQKAPEGV